MTVVSTKKYKYKNATEYFFTNYYKELEVDLKFKLNIKISNYYIKKWKIWVVGFN